MIDSYANGANIMSDINLKANLSNEIINQQTTELATLDKELTDCLTRNHYQILSYICNGSTCSVYKIVDINQTMLAAKIIDHRRIVPKFREQLLPNELMITRMVSHSNIIQIENVLQIDNYSIIISELAIDGDLLRFIQQTEQPLIDKYRKWFTDTTQGVAYLHSKGIGHRDIKADNVLLCNGGIAKLADFGYAILTLDLRGRVQLCTTFCGTPEYAAPEVLRHIPYNVTVSDCFSLGTLLYLLVTRKLPFGCGKTIRTKEGAFQQYKRIMAKNWAVCGEIEKDPNLYSLIDQLLHPDVKYRISAEQVLLHPWIKQN